MKWFAAHTVMGFQRIDGVGPISIFENIHLICAINSESASKKARMISEFEIENNDALEIDGQPARCINGGVRKIITVINETSSDPAKVPGDKSEISYIEYEVQSTEELSSIIQGLKTEIRLIE